MQTQIKSKFNIDILILCFWDNEMDIQIEVRFYIL